MAGVIMNTILQKAHYQKYEYQKVAYLAKHRLAGKKILDVGCGTGKYLKLFAQYACAVTGVDMNPLQVENLRSDGYAAYLPQELPDNETFDVVFMSHVIEHLDPSSLIPFLEKYLGMLAADGRLIILSPVLGKRFYYDFSHIRPYYPQSIWMLLGDCICAASYKSSMRIALDDIYFFHDSIRLRSGVWGRYYYPCVAQHEPYWKYALLSSVVSAFNMAFSALHLLSGGRLGVQASWMGIYRKTKDVLR